MQACRKPSKHKSILDFPGGVSVPWTTAGISIHHSDNFPPWYHSSGQRFYMKFTILNIDLMVLNIYLSIILGMMILRYMYFFFGQFSLSFFGVSLLVLHRKFINEINSILYVYLYIYKKGCPMLMVNILILNFYSFGSMSWIFPRVGYMLI